MNAIIVTAVIRHLLTAVGGGLATSGVVSGSDVEAVAGAIATIVGFVWSIWSKKQAQ